MTLAEPTTSPLTIKLFGPMQVLVEGKPLPSMRSRKALWLLALLTMRGNATVDRESIASMLWPNTEPSQALANLKTILTELRKALGTEGHRLQVISEGLVNLDLQGAIVDLLDFDRAVASSQPTEAVALHAGTLLEGCNEPWVHEERGTRGHDCMQALLILGDAALAEGDYRAALDWFGRAAALAAL